MCTVPIVHQEADSQYDEKMWLFNLEELHSPTLSNASTTESDSDSSDCDAFPERSVCVRDLDQLFSSMKVGSNSAASYTWKPEYISDDDLESVLSHCESDSEFEDGESDSEFEDDGFPPRSFCITDLSEIL